MTMHFLCNQFLQNPISDLNIFLPSVAIFIMKPLSGCAGVLLLRRAKGRTVLCHTVEAFGSTLFSHTDLSSVRDIFPLYLELIMISFSIKESLKRYRTGLFLLFLDWDDKISCFFAEELSVQGENWLTR